MRGTVVGVLRGGPSNEHEVSLRSGHAVITHLPEEHFTARDIYIDRQGVWHERGVATTPDKVLPTLDAAIIVLHGKYGQDGEVQKTLEQFGVPYTGPEPWHAFVSGHKVMAKEHAKELGIKTATYRFVERAEDAESVVHDVIRTFHQPVVVKPVSSGSSVGVSIVGGFAPVLQAVEELFARGEAGVVIEERILGREATVGVVDGLRGEQYYALPPVEIVPPAEAGFFSFDAKYSGATQEIVPGRFSKHIALELMESAKKMHEALGQRHYSRSDFIVSPKGIYFLETNNAPAVGFTTESLLPKSLAAVGVTFSDFLKHLVELTIKRPV